MHWEHAFTADFWSIPDVVDLAAKMGVPVRLSSFDRYLLEVQVDAGETQKSEFKEAAQRLIWEL